jgi:rhodanese-related sulfurtransferase
MALNYNVRPSVKFVQENLLLIAVAFVSGAMLLWPYVRRAGGGPSVSAAQATQLINREDALVLDVRDPGEYGSGHILGAKNVPLSRIAAGGSEIAAKRKDKPVIVYCDNGNRSTKAAAALRSQGYAKVVNLSGGLGAWQQAGLPVEK